MPVSEGRFVSTNGAVCDCDSCQELHNEYLRRQETRRRLDTAIRTYALHVSGEAVRQARRAMDSGNIIQMEEAVRRLENEGSDGTDRLRAQLESTLSAYLHFVSNLTAVRASEALRSGHASAMAESLRELDEAYQVYAYGDADIDHSDYSDYSDDFDPDSDDSGSDLIHYHDYRPRPVFHGDGPLFMGFELETAVYRNGSNSLSRAAKTVQDRLGSHGYLKEDGSISYGFEIVTHPMSYEYAINHFPWSMLDDMRDSDIGPDDSTGLHVHVSRAAFSSPAHIYRWMKFIYRNQSAVEAVARRQTSWAKFDRQHRRNIFRYATQPRYGDYYGVDRYAAINVLNSSTFEMRVFHSTDSRRELQAALGLVDATVRYAADIDSAAILNAKAWEFPSFVNWAYTAQQRGKSKATYSPLLTEIDRLELV